jgi:hypothetical protein
MGAERRACGRVEVGFGPTADCRLPTATSPALFRYSDATSVSLGARLEPLALEAGAGPQTSVLRRPSLSPPCI